MFRRSPWSYVLALAVGVALVVFVVNFIAANMVTVGVVLLGVAIIKTAFTSRRSADSWGERAGW